MNAYLHGLHLGLMYITILAENTETVAIKKSKNHTVFLWFHAKDRDSELQLSNDEAKKIGTPIIHSVCF